MCKERGNKNIAGKVLTSRHTVRYREMSQTGKERDGKGRTNEVTVRKERLDSEPQSSAIEAQKARKRSSD